MRWLSLVAAVNGLQVNGGVFDREFTKSLIIRDFDDVLKNPFRYVDLFLLQWTLYNSNIHGELEIVRVKESFEL